MPQFDVCVPAFPTTSDVPYLIVLQNDLLAGLRTTIAAPLRRRSLEERFSRLSPVVRIDGEDFVLFVPELAFLPIQKLGPVVANLSEDRDRIIAALDMLFTGI